MTEVDLCQLAHDHWKRHGWAVDGELVVDLPGPNGQARRRTLDQVITRDDTIGICEAKQTLNLKVISQASSLRRHAHYVVIAVWRPKRITAEHRTAVKLLRHHKLGLLYVDRESGQVERIARARKNIAPDTRPLEDAIAQAHSGSVPSPVPAGSRGGLRMTPGQRTWDPVRQAIFNWPHDVPPTGDEIWYALVEAGDTCGFRAKGPFKRELLKAARGGGRDGRGILGIVADLNAPKVTYSLTDEQREQLEIQHAAAPGSQSPTTTDGDSP